MAIDDNTSYELTGAQVKDLANRIKAKAADDAFVGATSSAPGSKGLVPAPAAGDDTKVLSGAGTWVNQPTVPTVNDATLTIQHNGTNVQTFTANQSTNATANIETIYADTIAPASPVAPISTSMVADGAITASKIDWSTIVAGTINVGSMGVGRSEQTVSIPTQANANYVVLLSLGGAMSGGWTKISLSVASKTISSFTMVNYNEAGYAVNNVLIDYLVIPR